MSIATPSGPRISRRQFLLTALAAAIAACNSPSTPPETSGPRADTAFPDTVPRDRQPFENWAGELKFPDVMTCAPRNADEAVAVVNWAALNGFAVRARGAMHNWSPLALSPGTTAATPVILLDTTRHFTTMAMLDDPMPAVRAGAGVLMEDLLAFLETHGAGFTATPAVGAISLGGALAINGHGCAVPASGETALPRQTYGSLSNRILALSAIVWSPEQERYALRQFDRRDNEIGVLLTSLGRTLITEVTLAVEPNQNLRCISHIDIPASEMFAAPGSGGRDMASFLDSSGRLEVIWYAFTDKPWLKAWHVSPTRPDSARAVSSPYNYPFSDNLPKPVTDLAQALVTGQPEAAPLFGQATYAVTAAGLLATASSDLWGPSKNTLLFIKPTTLRVHEFSYAVITRRDRTQQVIHDFVSVYQERLAAYQAEGRYPVNMPVEIRISGLDHAGDIGLAHAQEARLSALAPRPDHPDWDTAIWLAILTIPGTPHMHAFFREIEQWLIGHYTGDYAAVRPEWSKGWANSDAAAWTDADILEQRIPAALTDGRAATKGWRTSMATLSALDPAGVYQNAFLAKLTAVSR